MKTRHWIAGLSALAASGVAAKLLLRPPDVEWEKNREFIFHADRSRFVQVNGVPIHYQEAGEQSSPPMVLIHGFASSNLVWSKVLLGLADAGFRVIAPDLTGYGYSGKPRYFDYTIASQAAMISGFIKQLGIESTVLIGSSYGGAVAATIALDRPELVLKLIMVGAVTNNKPTRYMLMRLVGSPVIGDVLSPLLAGSVTLVRRRMKRVYDRHSWVLDEKRVQARHLPLRTRGTHRAIIRTVRGWDADRISRDAHSISQPTMIMWGENDREVPLRDGERLHHEIPGSRFIVFGECGHIPHEEYPERFIEVVSEFCSSKSESEE